MVTSIFVIVLEACISFPVYVFLDFIECFPFQSIFVKLGLCIYISLIFRIPVSATSHRYQMLRCVAVIPPKDSRNATSFRIQKIKKRLPILEKTFWAEGMLSDIVLHALTDHFILSPPLFHIPIRMHPTQICFCIPRHLLKCMVNVNPISKSHTDAYNPKQPKSDKLWKEKKRDVWDEPKNNVWAKAR